MRLAPETEAESVADKRMPPLEILFRSKYNVLHLEVVYWCLTTA